MRKSLKYILHKTGDWTVNILFAICMFCVIAVFLIIFVFSSFKIPSNSMEPALVTGDNILECKTIIGPRLFDVTKFLENKQTDIYRLPGLRKIKRNDVLVFNFPHPHDWQKIEMDIGKYYIKRCIALPGDTLSIQNGFYRISGVTDTIGNVAAQKRLSKRNPETLESGVLNGFPLHPDFPWTILSFGPLYIPKKGDSIPMNPENAILYRKIIEWEQHASLKTEGNTFNLDDRPLHSYTFEKNYYFMGGDRVEDSQDSRYWGFLPEEYIVGKAWIIWKSVDPYEDKFRWKRFLKMIN